MKPFFSVLAFIALAVFWIYCRSNAPVQAAINSPSGILESAIKVPVSVPFAQAIPFVPPPPALVQVAKLDKQAREEEARRALEAMEPEQVAEVYFRFIRADNPDLPEEIAMVVALAYAEEEFKYGLPKGLLPAIGYRESGQDPKAVSRCAAYGLMQVQVPTGFDAAKSLGKIKADAKPKDWPKYKSRLIKMLKDPKCNIELGAKTLQRYLHNNHGNINAALSQYSHRARNYATKVTARMRIIQAYMMK